MAVHTLLSESIATAVTGVTPDPVKLDRFADYLAIEAIFLYGAGGTNATAYVQTSLDGGTTWFDIASFQFTTSAASKVSALTTGIAPGTQAFTPGDGALTANTVINGVLGDRFRAKLTTTGTYTGATSLAVHIVTRG